MDRHQYYRHIHISEMCKFYDRGFGETPTKEHHQYMYIIKKARKENFDT